LKDKNSFRKIFFSECLSLIELKQEKRSLKSKEEKVVVEEE
jgi:hypothetical protein